MLSIEYVYNGFANKHSMRTRDKIQRRLFIYSYSPRISVQVETPCLLIKKVSALKADVHTIRSKQLLATYLVGGTMVAAYLYRAVEQWQLGSLIIYRP